MKEKIFVIYTVLSLTFSCVPAYAHSGRTDSSGGHRDNKNVSGLGYYHYHHGYSAHLHENGICPYNSSTITYSPSVSWPSSQQEISKASVSSMSVYINGYFIPTVDFNNTIYVTAEDLNNYGFDVSWNEADRSLKIKRNPSKPFSVDINSESLGVYDVRTSDINAYFYNEVSNSYVNVTSYNIGGKTIISLSNIGTRVIDDTNKCVWVTL